MKITIVCTSKDHPIYPRLEEFSKTNQGIHEVDVIQDSSELTYGDVLFLISCHEFINKEQREKYEQVLVLHASDLPEGRGWSPHIWQILEGATDIVVSMIQAEDEIDTGKIYGQIHVAVEKTALFDEINALLFDAELLLMQCYVDSPQNISPREQDKNIEPSYYPKRTPRDSELDIHRSICDQFEVMRVSDPHRFPSFFEIYGQKYSITLEKIHDDAND